MKTASTTKQSSAEPLKAQPETTTSTLLDQTAPNTLSPVSPHVATTLTTQDLALPGGHEVTAAHKSVNQVVHQASNAIQDKPPNNVKSLGNTDPTTVKAQAEKESKKEAASTHALEAKTNTEAEGESKTEAKTKAEGEGKSEAKAQAKTGKVPEYDPYSFEASLYDPKHLEHMNHVSGRDFMELAGRDAWLMLRLAGREATECYLEQTKDLEV